VQPSNIDLYLALADLLRVSFTPPRTDEACVLLDDVCTRVAPDSAPAWAHHGALLHVRGQHARAKHAYERALLLRPQDEATRVNLQKVMRVIRRANNEL
jgi:Flp pilus assembly protein TadD